MKNILRKFLSVAAIVLCLMLMFRSAYAVGERVSRNQLSVTAYVSELPEPVLEALNSGKYIKMQIIYAWRQECDFGGDIITYRSDDAIDVCCRATDDKERYKIRRIFYEADALQMALDFPYGDKATKFLKTVSDIQDENFLSVDSPYFCYLKMIDNSYVLAGNTVYPCMLKFPLKKSVQLSILARCGGEWSLNTLAKSLANSLERGEKINVRIIYDNPWAIACRPKHTLDAVCTFAKGAVSKSSTEDSYIELSFPYHKQAVDFIGDILQSGHFEKIYRFCIEYEGCRINCSLNLPFEASIQESV